MSTATRHDIMGLLHAGLSIKTIADHVGLSQWQVADWLISTRAIRRA
ncbi:MAG: hypothetical protein E6Q97_14640 [Desulfurellales bacterium]|nr:MAG: hypothetical protein E6Q97_14640 [Desulfurellales bacterium]